MLLGWISWTPPSAAPISCSGPWVLKSIHRGRGRGGGWPVTSASSLSSHHTVLFVRRFVLTGHPISPSTTPLPDSFLLQLSSKGLCAYWHWPTCSQMASLVPSENNPTWAEPRCFPRVAASSSRAGLRSFHPDVPSIQPSDWHITGTQWKFVAAKGRLKTSVLIPADGKMSDCHGWNPWGLKEGSGSCEQTTLLFPVSKGKVAGLGKWVSVP